MVADVLIRAVPEAVLAGVDAHAARLGLSRVEYIRRSRCGQFEHGDIS